jgi:hypothetical protein
MEMVLQSTPSSQIHQHAAEAARHGLGSSASPTWTSSLSAWLFSEERQVGGAAERVFPIGTSGERGVGFVVRGNAGLLAINAA